MFKQTLMITQPAYICIQWSQLKVKHQRTDEERRYPLEDLGMLILENAQIVITQQTLAHCATHNIVVVVCGKDHLPNGMMHTLSAHSTPYERVAMQISASQAHKGRLWKQTIAAKLRNQAQVLQCHAQDSENQNYKILDTWSKQVKNGDKTALEAQGSKLYWKTLFGPSFSRHRYGDEPNNLLNYGYTILRAAMARALVRSGLLPILGIHHHNKYNAFALADDMMEPYRPFVDWVVCAMMKQSPGVSIPISTHTKKQLLQILYAKVKIKNRLQPLQLGMEYTSSSLALCLGGQQKRLTMPYVMVKQLP